MRIQQRHTSEAAFVQAPAGWQAPAMKAIENDDWIVLDIPALIGAT
jgi:hypothetical protein